MGRLAHLYDNDSTDDEWKSMVEQKLTELHEHLDMAQKRAEQEREDDIAEMAKISGEMDSLRAAVSALVTRSAYEIKQAVGNIKMPVIPAQEKTDLAPVLRALTAIQERQLQKVLAPAPPEPKESEEWVFDIQRGPNGGITKVVAREV